MGKDIIPLRNTGKRYSNDMLDHYAFDIVSAFAAALENRRTNIQMSFDTLKLRRGMKLHNLGNEAFRESISRAVQYLDLEDSKCVTIAATHKIMLRRDFFLRQLGQILKHELNAPIGSAHGRSHVAVYKHLKNMTNLPDENMDVLNR